MHKHVQQFGDISIECSAFGFGLINIQSWRTTSPQIIEPRDSKIPQQFKIVQALLEPRGSGDILTMLNGWTRLRGGRFAVTRAYIHAGTSCRQKRRANFLGNTRNLLRVTRASFNKVR